MILQVAQTRWDVSSPSHWRLLDTSEDSQLDISYLGDAWYLFLDHHGHTNTQRFDSRDDAIGMVVEAFAKDIPL